MDIFRKLFNLASDDSKNIFTVGEFSVRSANGQHHSDSEFNEILSIGLFLSKNKLVNFFFKNSQNFSKYGRLKSEEEISRLAITWL